MSQNGTKEAFEGPVKTDEVVINEELINKADQSAQGDKILAPPEVDNDIKLNVQNTTLRRRRNDRFVVPSRIL